MSGCSCCFSSAIFVGAFLIIESTIAVLRTVAAILGTTGFGSTVISRRLALLINS